MTKLPRAEHQARAQLLERLYDPRDGTYCLGSVDEYGNIFFQTKGLLDCLTLEPIDVDVSTMRIGDFANDEGNSPDIKDWPHEARWEAKEVEPDQPDGTQREA